MENKFYEVLRSYGFKPSLEISQVYKSTWLIDGDYILKKNSDKKEVEKALVINAFLKNENIPVAEYVPAVSGELFVIFGDDIYTMMHNFAANILTRSTVTM